MNNPIKMLIKRRVWFAVAIIVSTLICLLPTPEDLTVKGKYTLGLLSLVVIVFLTEAIPFPAVALLIGFYQIFWGIRSFREIPQTYMHDAVLFLMGVLMMATVLIKYGLHQKVALAIVSKVGTSVKRIVFGIVTACALSATFFSEHPVASLMFPIGVTFSTLTEGRKIAPNLGKLLMLAIAYGCAIGGVATPSGGARNIIMIAYLDDFFRIFVSYGQWVLYTLPFTLILIPLTAFILPRIFKPEVTDLSMAIAELSEELKRRGPMRVKDWAVVSIFITTVVLWVTLSEKIGLGQVTIIVAIIYLIFGLADWEDYEKGVNWGVVLLYAGSVSLGRALRDTGVAAWLAEHFLELLSTIMGTKSNLAVLTSTTLVTALFTNTMADGPCVASIGPTILKIGELAGLKPIVVGVSCSVSSAFSYLLIIGTPANAIVYRSGFLSPKDFLKAGWIMFLLSLIILLLVITGLYWRLLGIW